jgi:hypothetical protein
MDDIWTFFMADKEEPKAEEFANSQELKTFKTSAPQEAEILRAETPRTETPRVETPRAQTPRAQTPRVETLRAETQIPQIVHMVDPSEDRPEDRPIPASTFISHEVKTTKVVKTQTKNIPPVYLVILNGNPYFYTFSHDEAKKKALTILRNIISKNTDVGRIYFIDDKDTELRLLSRNVFMFMSYDTLEHIVRIRKVQYRK